MRCACVAAFLCKSTYGTRDASSFEVKLHFSPVTVMSHTKPGYKLSALLAISVSLGRARSPVNYHIDSGIMFAIVPIKEINSLFEMGIFNKENPIIIDGSVSRLMFCYHSMIYTALNLNNNFCWDSTSYRWNESEVSSSESFLEKSHQF